MHADAAGASISEPDSLDLSIIITSRILFISVITNCLQARFVLVFLLEISIYLHFPYPPFDIHILYIRLEQYISISREIISFLPETDRSIVFSSGAALNY